MKRFLVVNLILFIPILVLLYSLFQLIPVMVRYIDSFNVSVQDVNSNYKKMAIVIISRMSGNETGTDDKIYIFERKDFNSIRKHIFLSAVDEGSARILRERALGYGDIPFFGESLTVNDRTGQPLITLSVESTKENVIEILFFNSSDTIGGRGVILHSLLLLFSFLVVFGSLGGVSDFTQRVVFHETKTLAYFFRAVRRNFLKSLSLSIFFTVVIGAIATNIYFYIFIISNDISVFIAALNFWMLIFFIFILFWVYPLLILNREESIWKVMKKSLFVSFDNFEFTFDSLIFLFMMCILSFVTAFTVPGLAGIFSFMNSALKDISYRYSRPDTA